MHLYRRQVRPIARAVGKAGVYRPDSEYPLGSRDRRGGKGGGTRKMRRGKEPARETGRGVGAVGKAAKGKARRLYRLLIVRL